MFTNIAILQYLLKANALTAIMSIPSLIGNLLYLSLYALCIIKSSAGPSTKITLFAKITLKVSNPGNFLK